MLSLQQQQEKKKTKGVGSVREEGARLVVKDAWLRGHTCVELRHDGPRPIFFCILCATRCYTDGALWDHLKGNAHNRNLEGAALKSMTIPEAAPLDIVPYSHELQGQLFLRTRGGTSRISESSWFQWLGKQGQQQPAGMDYSLVVFSYSDALGRAGNWNSLLGADCTTEQKAAATKLVGRGRRRTKQVDRICFICRQKMVAGKDVATLLNPSNKQMMCHSRNWRGAFHVFHTWCLISWILIFDAKVWMGQSLHLSKSARRNQRAMLEVMRNEINSSSQHQQLSSQQTNKNRKWPIFCPECQGTGFRYGGQLERPRYRLAQIFEWVLELVQARKVWTETNVAAGSGNSTSSMGLVYEGGEESSKGLWGHSSECQRRGLVECYSVAKASSSPELWIRDDDVGDVSSATNMEIDMCVL